MCESLAEPLNASSFFHDLSGSEKPGTREFVSINGYELWVPKGVFVEVPMQVDELIREYLHVPEQAAQEYRLDLNTGKADKLI